MIQTSIKLLLTGLMLLSCTQTKKPDNLSAVLSQLNIKIEDCAKNLIVEKVLPYSTEKSIIVIPRIAENNEGSISFDSYILIVDNLSRKIINKFYEANAWTSDAIQLENITIDFAPYKLNSETRAFGIRTLYEGSSRPNPYEKEEISLFVTKDSSLIRVLKNYPILSNTGEWDTNCKGEFYSEKKVLILSENMTNVFKDIIIKNNITQTKQRLISNECKKEENKWIKYDTLRFDNKEYK